ncbi:SMC-Scp complex subunit ScpB [Candidatus Kaiserbacteria bacterium]|nr:SMC-Scp complex subunit ScpB [Candidatus Kaiserbacteria bacterium]
MTQNVTTEDLAKRAAAFLFAEGGEIPRKKLASLVSCKEEAELKSILGSVRNRLKGSGIGLIETDTAVSLAVSEDTSGVVQEALKRELERDIGDAGLEVLAIVLYTGPSTRARVDYIRGVNSSSTLRTLLTRGLLERVGNPEDAREYLYRPTVELLAHLGIGSVNELPDHATIVSELVAFEKDGRGEKAFETHGGTTTD